MFDLNEAVRGWRRRMGEQPDIRAGDVDELEDHLHATMADLRASGLDEEEAFLVSARRLGDPEALAGEFAAAEPGVRRRLRLRWMVVGAVSLLGIWLVGEVLGDLLTGAGSLVQTGDTWMHVAAPPFNWMSSLLRLLVVFVGALLMWRLLTSDAAADRMKNLGLWTAGVAVLLLVAAAFVALLAGARTGSVLLGMRELSPPGVLSMPLLAMWLRWGVMLLLPVLLVVMLIVLGRPQGRRR